MKYLFVFGRDPELSLAELESYLEARKITYKILDTGKEAAVFELNSFEKKIIHDLGGTIKIAEVISSETRIERVEHTLRSRDFYSGTKNKIIFTIQGLQTDLDSFLLDYLKEYFKSIKLKALYKKEITPTRLSKHEDFLDFVVFKSHIAITLAVTKPQELKTRDLGRPAVDYMKTISLRLAKILINLSGAKENSILLDPFCGSGTILQEALLLGCNVIGTDRDPESIRQAKLNLEWLKSKYPLKNSSRLNLVDARKLTLFVPIKSIDAVATEPFMGPFIRKLPNLFQAKELVEELSLLYRSTLNQLSQVVKQGKKVVIVIPRFKTTEGKTLFIDFEQIAKETTFNVETKFFYAYKESKLLRDIYILRKD